MAKNGHQRSLHAQDDPLPGQLKADADLSGCPPAGGRQCLDLAASRGVVCQVRLDCLLLPAVVCLPNRRCPALPDARCLGSPDR